MEATPRVNVELELEECVALLKLLDGAETSATMRGEGTGTFERLGSVAVKIQRASGVRMEDVSPGPFDFSHLPSQQGAEQTIDFSDLAEPINEEHLRLADMLRVHAPEMLTVLTPAPGDDIPAGVVVSEVQPLVLLHMIHLFLAGMVEAMDADVEVAAGEHPTMPRRWGDVRDRFINGEREVLFYFLRYFPKFIRHAYVVALTLGMVQMVRDLLADQPAEAQQVTEGFIPNISGLFEQDIKKIVDYGPGRRLKRLPPGGSELAQKVWSFLMATTRRNGIDGRLLFPSTAKIVAELNRDPDLRSVKRRVVKGADERRPWTEKSLYEQLRRDKTPLKVIKQSVAANFS